MLNATSYLTLPYLPTLLQIARNVSDVSKTPADRETIGLGLASVRSPTEYKVYTQYYGAHAAMRAVHDDSNKFRGFLEGGVAFMQSSNAGLHVECTDKRWYLNLCVLYVYSTVV
jgi:hypothetical protein